MTKRRGNNEGSLTLRKDGLWAARISHEGKRIAVYGKTKEEAGLFAETMGGAIFETLRSLFSAAADYIPLLYGGSMNAGNAGEFAAQDCIHGGLVGGAALHADQFLQVAAAVAAAKG